MMEFIQNLASRLQTFGAGAYWIISLIVYLETIILIGQFIPGSLFLAFVGFLCYLQIYDFGDMLFSVFLGHYIGELTNYYLGRVKGRALFSESSRFLKPRFLEMAERRFTDGGAKILILFQFAGFLRPFIAFAAGASHYPLPRFMFVMAIGALIWSTAPLALGFLLGESWQQAVQYFEGLSIVILVLIPTVFFSGWLIRRLLEHAGFLAQSFERFSRRVHRSPRYQRIASLSPTLFRFLEARLSLTRNWGLRASLGWTVSSVLLLLFLLILRDVRLGAHWRELDESTVNLLGQFRRAAADQAFLFISKLGSLPNLIVMGAAAGIFCTFAGQYKSLVVIVGSMLFSMGLSNIISYFYTRTPPVNLIDAVDLYAAAFPSSHASLAVALFGSLYVWLWNHPGRVRLRATLAFVVLITVLLVGFSRIYLGILFPSEVLAGYCLGCASVVLVGTIAGNIDRVTDVRRRADLAALVVMVAGVATAYFGYIGHQVLPGARDITSEDTVEILAFEDGWSEIPRAASGMSGRLVLPVNLLVRGTPDALLASLQSRGWQEVDPDAFFTQNIASPLFPAFIDSMPARHTLEKREDDGRQVLRLWPTHIAVTNERVWVGSAVREFKQERMLGFKSYKLHPDVDLALQEFRKELGSIKSTRIQNFRRRDLYLWKHPHFTHGTALLVRAAPL